jgi:hypothetical protein
VQNGLKIALAAVVLLGCETLSALPSFTNSIAFVGQSMDYREYDKEGVFADSENSSFFEMTGVEINFAFLFDKDANSHSQLDVNFLGLGGITQYEGFYLESGLPTEGETTTNYIADIDMTYKKFHRLSDVLEVHYGLGLGYYMWERGLSSSQVELYDWFYVKPTAGITLEMVKNLHLGLNLAYKYALNPAMSVTSPNLDFTLGGVNAFVACIPLTYTFSNAFDMFVAFEIEQQNIEASGTKQSNGVDYYEPDSTAKNQYLKLGMTFKY